MTVSIRTSLTIAAAGLAVVCAGFIDPADKPAHAEDVSSPCATGAQQSPINIANTISAQGAAPRLAWKSVRGGWVMNTGETIQVDVDDAGDIEIEGVRYGLKQFHFHHPSEHTIDGKSYPLELHFVHAGPDGRLAVVGVLFAEGAPNPALDNLWATAPGRAGKAAVAFEIDPARLAPAGSSAYRYEGSLTTPPCTETVAWTVLAETQTASAAQIAAFATLFPDNHRAVQPLNRRFVLKTGS